MKPDFASALGVERHVVVEGVEVEVAVGGEAVVVASVRPSRRQALRCPRCRRRCRRYDRGDGRRRWRGLDLGSTRVFLEAEAPRVRCGEHGVLVAGVPWARHDTAFTAAFEEQTAWLAAHAAASTVAVLMRSSWRAVTGMVTRVVAEARGRTDRLAGVTKVAIDEKAYRKGHRYLTVVTDLDTGRVIWAAEGRCKAVVAAFFTALGPGRAARLTHVGCDGADWIHTVVAEHAPQAVICLDSFHVVAWASEAVEEVRRRLGRDLKAAGRHGEAATLKGSRWAVLKNPARLSGDQQESLAAIKTTNGPLYRAYLIKEQLREVFRVKGPHGRALLGGVIAWASRSRIPEMLDLARKLRRHRDLIANTLDHAVTSALAENTNTHIAALTRRAYGFHSPEALIAMIELTRGGLCPDLPGRS
jgi:transposase